MRTGVCEWLQLAAPTGEQEHAQRMLVRVEHERDEPSRQEIVHREAHPGLDGDVSPPGSWLKTLGAGRSDEGPCSYRATSGT